MLAREMLLPEWELYHTVGHHFKVCTDGLDASDQANSQVLLRDPALPIGYVIELEDANSWILECSADEGYYVQLPVDEGINVNSSFFRFLVSAESTQLITQDGDLEVDELMTNALLQRMTRILLEDSYQEHEDIAEELEDPEEEASPMDELRGIYHFAHAYHEALFRGTYLNNKLISYDDRDEGHVITVHANDSENSNRFILQYLTEITGWAVDPYRVFCSVEADAETVWVTKNGEELATCRPDFLITEGEVAVVMPDYKVEPVDWESEQVLLDMLSTVDVVPLKGEN